MSDSPRKLIVSQRVVISDTGERRDALDQQWTRFLWQAGFLCLPLPNVESSVDDYLREPHDGILLTGGNDLRAVGGDAPDRDAVEFRLVEHALNTGTPLLGVCRGMQVIQTHFGATLETIDGHVTPHQTQTHLGKRISVNAFHNFGTRHQPGPLLVDGVADDGVVKAISHPTAPVVGIMWHPERINPFRSDDLMMFRTFYGDAV